MLFRWTLEKIAEISHGFICLNIQETDLAGHAQDVQRYAHLLELSDAYIGKIIEAMTVGDRLIVMADHGNDPTIGHSNHTRECVPLLVYGKELSNAFLGERETMADVASTVADYFGVTQPEHGQSFLRCFKKIKAYSVGSSHWGSSDGGSLAKCSHRQPSPRNPIDRAPPRVPSPPL